MRGTRFLSRFLPAVAGISILLFGAGAPAAFSQTMTTGDIVGTVTDASGAVIPNAKITVTFTDTNESHTTVSNQSGQYRFSLLQPGNYTVTAEATGLKSKTAQFTLLVGQESAINLKLEVQGTREVVEVQAEASILQTENANQASGFNTSQVVVLPANGGDITTIAYTVPGVIQGKGSDTFATNGIPGAANLFTLNGADDMDPYLNINNSGASNNLLGANEVAEASVVLNAYSADYGRMSGAQVNYVGKTGTNSFHGNLFHNFNDKILNANTFFNNQASLQEPRADSHNFGGSFGGPIKKNKLFFFFNYESLQYSLPTSGVVDIPSPQMETYTLGTIPAEAKPLYQDAFALWNGAPGAKNAVPVTNGNGPLQDGHDHLGCGIGTFWNAGIQAPGGGVFGTTVPCSDAFAENASEINKESLVTVRGDYNINDKQKLSARYNYDWGIQATGPSFINSAFNSLSNQPSDQGQLTYTYVISPSVVNNFIGSGSWYTAIFGVANFAATSALMPERINVSDTGWAALGAGIPDGRNVGQVQLVDDLTWVHGNHTFKTGINYRFDKITDTSISSGSQIGSYTFADLTDFTTGQVNATGLGDTFTQSYPDIFAAHIRMSSLGAYAQDEWKVRRNLTLTLGFRVEHDGNPACLDNCFARMDTQFGLPGYVGGANVSYNQTIQTGLHNEYQNLETAIPEPRFGFAWSPDSKTVVRGGIGLFATLFSGSSAANIFDNAPSKFSPTVTFGEIGLPSDPNSSAYAALAAYNVFTSGFKAGDTLTQLQASLGKIPFSAPSYYSYPNNFVAPKTTEWSVEIERSLTSHDVLALTYTGNHGYDQAVTNGWSNAFLLLASNGLNKYYGTSFAGLPTSAPDPRFLTVYQVLTQGYSNYDAMTLQLRHSLKWGFQGQVGWVWSHALGLSTISNPYDMPFNYGNQSFDARNTVVSDLIWTVPFHFGNRFAKAALGGWNFGMKFYFYTGFPFSSSDSKINAQVNSGGGFSGTFLATDIAPQLPSNCTAVHGTSTPPCFTTADFETYNSTSGVATPVQNNFGETGPGVFRGPDFFDIDTQLTKKFFVKEKYAFEFGAQAFNTLNHPNFGNPTASITSGTLGTTTSIVGPTTSPYGSFQSSTIVGGRLIVVTARFSF
ncbi:MAG TPA: carboxypeptidase regulatory-like domain-containing protein [Bryobacteraceae bacterium]|nr:carboxypeptidase regulatory-like domain-containing protein [Bryobacteraceae bacterium]